MRISFFMTTVVFNLKLLMPSRLSSCYGYKKKTRNNHDWESSSYCTVIELKHRKKNAIEQSWSGGGEMLIWVQRLLNHLRFHTLIASDGFFLGVNNHSNNKSHWIMCKLCVCVCVYVAVAAAHVCIEYIISSRCIKT